MVVEKLEPTPVIWEDTPLSSSQSTTFPWTQEEPSPVVIIKFQDDTGVRLEDGEFVPPPKLEPEFEQFQWILDHFGAQDPTRLFSRSDEDLEAERKEYWGGRPPDLTQHFRVTVRPELHEQFVAALSEMWYVEAAYTAPRPAPPPSVPNYYPGKQGYLRPATTGIDARYAWENYGADGGYGQRVTIAIIDYHWNANHNDLPAVSEPAPSPVASAQSLECRNHGTAVLGILLARHEEEGGSEKGMRGIVPQASARMYAADTDPDVNTINVADAISLATGVLVSGHVLLIEQQTWDTNGELVPVEYNLAEFNAIWAATQKGIIVVEPAGNGNLLTQSGVPLDQYNDRFYYTDEDTGELKDSKAILVGAGRTRGPQQRARCDFSNYGQRVDVQGWGEFVGTLGYGDLHPGGNPPNPALENDFYIDDFGGTSAASAIVAGVVAALQSICQAKGWSIPKVSLMPPSTLSQDMRQLLIDTGTLQQGADHIGKLPNLAAAIARLKQANP
jgi:serine protease